VRHAMTIQGGSGRPFVPERVSVVIPTYNYARFLPFTLDSVFSQNTPDLEVVIVDDGSTDQPPQILADATDINLIRHVDNRGYGQSLSDAFTFAIRRNYDWLITMDCDGQHEPARIPDLLRVAAEDDADIISGSRYLQAMPGNATAPADRRAINQKITDLLNELLDLRITDAFCGFKAYRVSALDKLHITVPGYGMPLQLWVQAARRGLRIREVPVPIIYNDPTRCFGGAIDDPNSRLLYYYEVLICELGQRVRELEPVSYGHTLPL